MSQTTKQEAEEYIIQLLKDGQKLTTKEIVELTENAGVSCPDEPVRFLNNMRMKGVINGHVSIEHKGWLWWV